MNTSCIANTHMQKLAISTSNSLQNDAVEAFPINILVWVFFGCPDWDMGPIKCTYDLREMANVLKFLYGLPTLGVGLVKFDKTVRKIQNSSVKNMSFTFIHVAVH